LIDFDRDFLPAEAQTLRFINADLIAEGLAPFNPKSASMKAGRLMLEEIDECVAPGQTFAFETTLSGKGYLRKIALWHQLGYQVKLWFLSLPSRSMYIEFSWRTVNVFKVSHRRPPMYVEFCRPPLPYSMRQNFTPRPATMSGQDQRLSHKSTTRMLVTFLKPKCSSGEQFAG
jgi:hypothetical protein